MLINLLVYVTAEELRLLRLFQTFCCSYLG